MKFFHYEIPQGTSNESGGMADESGKRKVNMIEGSIRHLAEYKGKPCVWILAEIGSQIVERTFHIVGTGHELPEVKGSLEYVGTYQHPPFVWHLFEEK